MKNNNKEDLKNDVKELLLNIKEYENKTYQYEMVPSLSVRM